MTPPEAAEDFLRPEKGLPKDAILIRPSLWVAAGQVGKFLLGLAAALVPVFIGLVTVEDDPAGRSVEGLWGRLIELGRVADEISQVAFAAVGLFLPAVRLIFTRYSIGPDDVRVKHQLLGRSEQRVDWKKVTALRYRRTLFDRLVRTERLDIVAYGKRGTTLRLLGLRKDSGIRDFASRKMRETASVEALFEND